MRAAVFLSVCAIGVLLAAAPAGGATPAAATAGPAGPTPQTQPAIEGETNLTTRSAADGRRLLSPSAPTPVEITRTVDRTPEDVGLVSVEYAVSLPPSVVNFTARPASSLGAPFNVTATDGFSRTPSGALRATSPDGEATTASFTYAVETNTTRSSGYETVETPAWAFVGPPQLGVAWQYYYSGAEPRVRERTTVASGHAADVYAFAGAATTHRRVAGDQSITLVVPAAATLPRRPDSVLASLASGSRRLEVGARDPNVTAYALPPPMRDGGASFGGREFWIRDDGIGSATLLFHEYVHTRQRWTDGDARLSLADDVEWFTEASADYYGGLLAWAEGNTTAASFRRYVATTRSAGGVLRDADADPIEDKNYYKGRRVLAALDIRIRGHTDGNATLADVFARINRHNGTVAYADLRDAVVARTNDSTGSWLDTHVSTARAPSIPTDIAAAYPGIAPSLRIENLTATPDTVGANETVTQTVSARVRDASDDGRTDAYAIALPAGTTVRTAEVDVTDAAGDPVDLVAGPTVTGSGETRRIAFEIAPDGGADTAALSVEVTVEGSTPPADSTRTGTLALEAADSATGNATATTRITVETAPDAVYDRRSVAAGYDADGDGRIGIAELGAAATDFADGSLRVGQLGTVAAAFANS